MKNRLTRNKTNKLSKIWNKSTETNRRCSVDIINARQGASDEKKSYRRYASKSIQSQLNHDMNSIRKRSGPITGSQWMNESSTVVIGDQKKPKIKEKIIIKMVIIFPKMSLSFEFANDEGQWKTRDVTL